MIKKYKRSIIVKNDTIKAVHDDDLINLIKSLGIYEDLVNGKKRCIFCNSTISINNLDAVVPSNNEIEFTCNNDGCHRKLLGLGENNESR